MRDYTTKTIQYANDKIFQKLAYFQIVQQELNYAGFSSNLGTDR